MVQEQWDLEKKEKFPERYGDRNIERILGESIGSKTVANIIKVMNYDNSCYFLDYIFFPYFNYEKICKEQGLTKATNAIKLLKVIIDIITNFPINNVFEISSFRSTNNNNLVGYKTISNREYNSDDEYNISNLKYDSDYCHIALKKIDNNIMYHSLSIPIEDPYLMLKKILETAYKRLCNGISVGSSIEECKRYYDKAKQYYDLYEEGYININNRLNDYFVVMDELINDESQ